MPALPVDHPLYFGPQPGAEEPSRLAALARDHGAMAVLLTSGALRRCAGEIGDRGVIVRIDATVSHRGGPDTVMHPLHDVAEAAALGADMVVVNCFIGIGDSAQQSALLQKLAAVSRECERFGVPLCGEIIPRAGSSAGSPGHGAGDPDGHHGRGHRAHPYRIPVPPALFREGHAARIDQGIGVLCVRCAQSSP